jgi:hypothetical protein
MGTANLMAGIGVEIPDDVAAVRCDPPSTGWEPALCPCPHGRSHYPGCRAIRRSTDRVVIHEIAKYSCTDCAEVTNLARAIPVAAQAEDATKSKGTGARPHGVRGVADAFAAAAEVAAGNAEEEIDPNSASTVCAGREGTQNIRSFAPDEGAIVAGVPSRSRGVRELPIREGDLGIQVELVRSVGAGRKKVENKPHVFGRDSVDRTVTTANPIIEISFEKDSADVRGYTAATHAGFGDRVRCNFLVYAAPSAPRNHTGAWCTGSLPLGGRL